MAPVVLVMRSETPRWLLPGRSKEQPQSSAGFLGALGLHPRGAWPCWGGRPHCMPMAGSGDAKGPLLPPGHTPAPCPGTRDWAETCSRRSPSLIPGGTSEGHRRWVVSSHVSWMDLRLVLQLASSWSRLQLRHLDEPQSDVGSSSPLLLQTFVPGWTSNLGRWLVPAPGFSPIPASSFSLIPRIDIAGSSSPTLSLTPCPGWTPELCCRYLGPSSVFSLVSQIDLKPTM